MLILKFKDNPDIEIEFEKYTFQSNTVQLSPILGNNPVLLDLKNIQHNTFLDFSGCDDYMVLNFNYQNEFCGASIHIKSVGSYVLSVQQKTILLLPFPISFELMGLVKLILKIRLSQDQIEELMSYPDYWRNTLREAAERGESIEETYEELKYFEYLM